MTVFSKVKSMESVLQNDAGTFIYKYYPKSFILLCHQHIHVQSLLYMIFFVYQLIGV